MIIDGPIWFVCALLICGAHTLFLLDWRRESRMRLKEYAEYDAESKRRHDEFMAALREARKP